MHEHLRVQRDAGGAGGTSGRDDLEELQRVLREQTARLNGLITRRGGARFELVLPAKRA